MPLKISGVAGYAHSYFSRNCSRAFVVIDRMKVRTKFEVCSFTRSWDNSGYLKTVGSPWIRRSRSSKVVDIGTNRKHVCDFLLVRHSNLVLVLHHFGDIVGFCAPGWPHPYSTLILGVFPLHQMAHDVGVSPSRGFIKLFGREIIFKEFQPMWSRYLNVTDGQSETDRRTDGRTDDIYCGITALCVASRGKNTLGYRLAWQRHVYWCRPLGL